MKDFMWDIRQHQFQCPSNLRHILSLATQNTGITGLNPTLGRMCVCIFLCCVALCVGRGLVLGQLPVQGVLLTVQ